ncbi:MAG: hypothetical protein C0497_08050 [Gemmatimonas sp.]|nr:hypothetical protein [Gemmatimonas sp.]
MGLVAAAAASLGACKEQLDAGSACPSLCPGLSVPIKDTVLSPVLEFDTTLVGYPSIGTEQGIPLASRGDTLDVRGVIRFDSLQRRFAPPGDTLRPVTRVDSAFVRMRLNLTQSRLPASVTFELYDVDTIADDGNTAAVLALFRPGRLITSRTLARAEITDSLRFPLSTAWLLQKIQSGANLRVGLRLAGTGPVSLRVHSVETGLAAEVRYHVSPDTAVRQVVVSPYSKTPVEPPALANDFRDYAVVARNALPQAGALAFSTGGVPARRAYLRFNVPQWLLDSTTIVRATLLLTQAPQRGFDEADSVTVVGQAVAATKLIRDLYRSSQILIPAGLFIADSIRVAPADSGVRLLEMNGLLRVWKSSTAVTEAPQRAIVLLQKEEGLHGAEVRFFNARSPASVRPRLRVSYIPRVNFGVP